MAAGGRFALWRLSECALTGKYCDTKGRDDREQVTNNSTHDFSHAPLEISAAPIEPWPRHKRISSPSTPLGCVPFISRLLPPERCRLRLKSSALRCSIHAELFARPIRDGPDYSGYLAVEE
jgi:hypothetical protein